MTTPTTRLSPTEALLKAQDIAGRVRLLGDVSYIDEPEERHRKLDALLCDLLRDDYPELVAFYESLRLWYG